MGNSRSFERKNKPERVQTRTEAQVFSREPIKVTLGDRQFTIRPQAVRQGRKFRQAFAKATESLDEMMVLAVAAADETGQVNMKHADAVRIMRMTVTSSYDDLLDCLYEYDPSLKQHKDYIEQHATDEQVLDGVVAITRLVSGPFLGKVASIMAAGMGMTEAQVLQQSGQNEMSTINEQTSTADVSSNGMESA